MSPARSRLTIRRRPVVARCVADPAVVLGGSTRRRPARRRGGGRARQRLATLGLRAAQLLRDKRHGLVASLRRLDGRSVREINAWLNRATGVTRVEDASLAQLERSIDLLLAELDRRSKPLAR